ncbi:MAG: YitT family protein [Oscillospiraceae bacterium]|nr:YitT family protein [Oscillospiraceae bacterium]
MNSNKIKTLLLDILFDIAGGLLVGLSVNFFTAPNQIAPGGITGIATLVNYLSDFPIGTLSFLINVPLILIAFKYLGKRFSIYTLKSMTILSFSVDFVALFLEKMGISGYEGDAILAGLMGGVLTGCALALVFMRGSTTGGLDIVSRLLKKKYPHLSMGRLLFMADACVLSISVLVYGNIESGLYGLITIFTCSKMLDAVLYGGDKGKCIMIISEKHMEIAKAINNDVRRGVTMLSGQGAYSEQERKVVLCAVRDNQYPAVKKVVHAIDPNAFIIVNAATEILGTGFRPIELDN